MAALDLVQQSVTQFKAMPPGRQAALAVAALGSLAFCLWIALGTGSPHYRVLYRSLAEADAARVVEALGAERIPYRLSDGGSAVQVPAGQVHEARIRLAGKGLPGGAGAGFELFDEPRFGTTEFVHRVNYRRALQGELARSVEHLDAVERARVQIAIPEPSPFVGERERTPSASVVVRLAPGKDLAPDRVRGIVHLVSSSVEALVPERVSVVDEAGRLLAPAADAALGANAPSARQRYQNALERELAQRVEAMLARTVGAERVVARVRADLEWTQTEETEERFDPNSQIERSEQRSTEIESDTQGGGGGGGRPGVASNVPGGEGGAPTSGSDSNRTTETINYELSKTVRHSVEPLGGIKRLTLAVLIDGKPNAEGAFQAWEAESIQQFEELARHAVGFSEERGDRITITNAPFRSFSAEEIGGGGGFALPQGVSGIAEHVIRVVGLLVALVFFGRLVVKPLAHSLQSSGADPVAERIAVLEARLVASGAIPDEAALQPGTEPPAIAAAPGLGVGASNQQDQSLQAIRSWLRES